MKLSTKPSISINKFSLTKKRLSKKLKGQQKRKKRRECLSEKSHSQKSTRVPNINDSIKHIIYYISLDIYSYNNAYDWDNKSLKITYNDNIL